MVKGSVNERVTFEQGSEFCEIDEKGFKSSPFLVSITLPPSLEVTSGFKNCRGLTEVLFEPGIHLREVCGFLDSKSHSRIDIPASVEVLCREAFQGCTAQKEVIFRGSRSWIGFLISAFSDNGFPNVFSLLPHSDDKCNKIASTIARY
jgi:hypothetical protein